MTKQFDARKIKKLTNVQRYSELYYHWLQAEMMIASNLPDMRRCGLRLKRKVEGLYSDWFGPEGHLAFTQPARMWAEG